MLAFRHLLAQRHLAALICAAALLLRLAVPGGYMIATDHGHVAVTICSGVAGTTMSMAMPGMPGEMPDHAATGHDGSDHDKKDHGGTAMPCPFAGLTAPALGGAGPLLVAVLVAFIMAIGLLPTAPLTLGRRTYVRPPLRGPPAHL